MESFIEIMRESSTRYNTVQPPDLPPELQGMLNPLIGSRGDPGTGTKDVKVYLQNLVVNAGLSQEIFVRINSILDFLPMVMYLPFGCLHDFGDKKVARLCLMAGLQVWKNDHFGQVIQDIINVLRYSEVSLPVLGLDITTGDVRVRGNADTGEDTFSTTNTTKLHTVWEKLFEYIFTEYIPSLTREDCGARWNFIPIRESFSMLKTEPKNDVTKRALADKIINWVNSRSNTVTNIASLFYAALDVTDTVGLMVCDGRVLEAAEDSETMTMDGIDAFQANPASLAKALGIGLTRLTPHRVEDVQKSTLQGAVYLTPYLPEPLKIYFQVILEDGTVSIDGVIIRISDVVAAAAAAASGYHSDIHKFLQYTKSNGQIIPLALLPREISVNNIYLSCKGLTPPYNIKSRNPGASVGACNVIWLVPNLVSTDKAVLLEACKGDGDQTVSDLCRIAVGD